MRGLAATGLVGVSAASTYAGLVEPRAYELTETDIPIRDLPPAFDGFRIATANGVHLDVGLERKKVGRLAPGIGMGLAHEAVADHPDTQSILHNSK